MRLLLVSPELCLRRRGGSTYSSSLYFGSLFRDDNDSSLPCCSRRSWSSLYLGGDRRGGVKGRLGGEARLTGGGGVLRLGESGRRASRYAAGGDGFLLGGDIGRLRGDGLRPRRGGERGTGLDLRRLSLGAAC